MNERPVMKLPELARFKSVTRRKKIIIYATLSGILAGALCLLIFGVKIINPTNTDWLYANGDISQHQIGWEFFRQDGWNLPLGAIKNLAHPEGTSLVYMDSIPVAAILLKPFGAILPDSFQYLGLWGLMSFVLAGILAAIIIGRFTRRPEVIILGSLLVVLAPIFLTRMYQHTALASQWILLLSIVFIVYRHKISKPAVSIAAWSLLLSLSVSIHPYFVPMTLVGLIVFLILSKASFVRILFHLIVGIASFVATFWLIGGFVTKDVGTSTLGLFGADINAIFNPMNASFFMKGFPTIEGGYEGMAYLGLGVYLLLFFLLSYYLLRLSQIKIRLGTIRQILSKHKRIMLISFIVLMTVVIAIGPVWYLNGNQLVVFELPSSVATLLSTFRSTGRFMWIVCYVIIFIAIISAARIFNKSQNRLGVSIFLVLIVSIQCIDVVKSGSVRQKRHDIIVNEKKTNRFHTAQIVQMLDRKDRVAYTHNSLHADTFFELGPLVASRKMTINDGYVSREPVESVNRETSTALDELRSGKLKNDTVYVTNDSNDVSQAPGDDVEIIVVEDKTWLVATKDHQPAT